MSTLYPVMRADRSLVSTDIFGVEHKTYLEKGCYMIPAFDTRESVVDFWSEIEQSRT
jgi:hypothetical protein